MTEIMQLYRSWGWGWTLRSAALAGLVLLSATVNAAASQEQATPLTLSQPLARGMRGGEQHTYQISLNAGQYARVVLEQKGIDVVVALSAADGKPLLEVDNNLSGTRGMEEVSLVAEVSGNYLFNVRSLEKDASAGRYEIRL